MEPHDCAHILTVNRQRLIAPLLRNGSVLAFHTKFVWMSFLYALFLVWHVQWCACTLMTANLLIVKKKTHTHTLKHNDQTPFIFRSKYIIFRCKFVNISCVCDSYMNEYARIIFRKIISIVNNIKKKNNKFCVLFMLAFSSQSHFEQHNYNLCSCYAVWLALSS